MFGLMHLTYLRWVGEERSGEQKVVSYSAMQHTHTFVAASPSLCLSKILHKVPELSPELGPNRVPNDGAPSPFLLALGLSRRECRPDDWVRRGAGKLDEIQRDGVGILANEIGCIVDHGAGVVGDGELGSSVTRL